VDAVTDNLPYPAEPQELDVRLNAAYERVFEQGDSGACWWALLDGWLLWMARCVVNIRQPGAFHSFGWGGDRAWRPDTRNTSRTEQLELVVDLTERADWKPLGHPDTPAQFQPRSLEEIQRDIRGDS
jgi:hypothetical protein